MRLAAAVLALGALGAAGPAHAQAVDAPVPIVFVVDISGSMSDDDGNGRTKIEAAKASLLNALQLVEPGTPIGLRTYPDQADGSDCNSGSLRFDIAPRDPGSMSAFVRSLRATGDTPTAEALTAAAADLEAAGYERGVLALLSDGESTCAPPCDAAAALARSGVDLTIVAFGFRISDEGREELQCIADATGGAYADVGDGVALEDEFGRLSRPDLRIEDLRYPPRVVADVAGATAGVVNVTATLRNESEHEARNVTATLRFDQVGPGVLRPVLHLGNLGPGAERAVGWRFQPGVAYAGETIGFTIVARAANAPTDAEKRGSVRVTDETDPAHAGPILRERRKIAILGDSYSSGEGADDYLEGRDAAVASCHRSVYTYLVQEFQLPDQYIVACSGAVANDVFFGQARHNVPPQLDHLAALVRRDGVDAVALTLGGNDAGFSIVARSCLTAATDCSKGIHPSPDVFLPTPTEEFVGPRLEGLPERLETALKGVARTLNSPSAVARRDGVAPVLVLAYPVSIPLAARRCRPLGGQLTQTEVEFLWRYATRVNGVVEEAAEEARRAGLPVFYVADTERAFQPNHTACDGEPYVRPFNRILSRSIQELLHPNKEGYRAMTRAIVTWSLSPAGEEADEFLESAAPAGSAPAAARSASLDLGALAGGEVPTLRRGTTYPLTVGGFAPHSPVEVTIRSEPHVLAQTDADEDGTVATQVGIPPELDAGRHTIAVAGAGPDGESRVVEIPVRVAGDGLPGEVRVLALGAAGTGIAALLVWLAAAGCYLLLRRGRMRE